VKVGEFLGSNPEPTRKQDYVTGFSATRLVFECQSTEIETVESLGRERVGRRQR
jgi:hypothetical protein